MKLRRPRLTYANVVATVALFAALGGVSYAATALPKNSVGTSQVQVEAVRTGKIADGAVTASKLGQGVRERIAASGVPSATVSTPESVKHADAASHADSADNAETADVAITAKDADALGASQPTTT